MRHTPAALLAMSASSPDKLAKSVSLATEDLSSQAAESFVAQIHAISSQDHNEPYRISVVAQNQDELQRMVNDIDFHALEASPEWPQPPKIALLFTGQGAQFLGMGQQLYHYQPVFKAAFDECTKHLKAENIDLHTLIFPDIDRDDEDQIDAANTALSQTGNTQPAMFALEYALAKLWLSWGLTPDFVMGHSVGEYPAATIAGMMSLNDGLKLIAARGRLMQALPEGGVMAAVMASHATMNHFELDGISIAGLNGPKQTVVSGEAESVLALLHKLKEQGIRSRQLQVSHAFHSHLMDPMLEEYGKVADKITFAKPEIALVSNVTGKKINKVVDSNYWQQHVRKPVDFIGGMQTLENAGTDIYLEIGPQAILTNMGARCLEDPKQKTWLYSMSQTVHGQAQMLHSLSKLYQLGMDIDWQKVSF